MKYPFLLVFKILYIIVVKISKNKLEEMRSDLKNPKNLRLHKNIGPSTKVMNAKNEWLKIHQCINRSSTMERYTSDIHEKYLEHFFRGAC